MSFQKQKSLRGGLLFFSWWIPRKCLRADPWHDFGLSSNYGPEWNSEVRLCGHGLYRAQSRSATHTRNMSTMTIVEKKGKHDSDVLLFITANNPVCAHRQEPSALLNINQEKSTHRRHHHNELSVRDRLLQSNHHRYQASLHREHMHGGSSPVDLIQLTIRRPRRPPHMISLCITVEQTSDSQRHLINDLKNHNRDSENNKSGWMQIL